MRDPRYDILFEPMQIGVAFQVEVFLFGGMMVREFSGRTAFAFLASAFIVASASAANTPCSGKKGGISHCQGRTFVCNDGSVSGSKRNCERDFGRGSSLGLFDNQSSDMRPARKSSDCDCRSGTHCTGPRGGQYCITNSGKKSYLRK